MSFNVDPCATGSPAADSRPIGCATSCPAGVRILCDELCRDERLRWACDLAEAGAQARRRGDEAAAEQRFRAALDHLLGYLSRSEQPGSDEPPTETVLFGARCALECGEVAEARRLIESCDCSLVAPVDGATVDLRDIEAWPDGWLVAAVRRTPPDEPALDVLARRHWQALFGRCQLLTAHREKAADLAQEAWCRVLRRRHLLKPGGNFPAYLQRTATNLWRDWLRANQRAGVLAEHRLSSLDATVNFNDEGGVSLIDLLPDLAALEGAAAARLHEDVHQALARLEPALRDIVVARYLDGESCAEIGRRYQRTEQTVNGWLRRGVQELQTCLKQTVVSKEIDSTS